MQGSELHLSLLASLQCLLPPGPHSCRVVPSSSAAGTPFPWVIVWSLLIILVSAQQPPIERLSVALQPPTQQTLHPIILFCILTSNHHCQELFIYLFSHYHLPPLTPL